VDRPRTSRAEKIFIGCALSALLLIIGLVLGFFWLNDKFQRAYAALGVCHDIDAYVHTYGALPASWEDLADVCTKEERDYCQARVTVRFDLTLQELRESPESIYSLVQQKEGPFVVSTQWRILEGIRDRLLEGPPPERSGTDVPGP